MSIKSKSVQVLFITTVALLVLAWGLPAVADDDTLDSGAMSHEHHHEKTAVELVAREPLSGVPCIAGFAGPYPCRNVDLLAFMPLNTLVGSTGSDVWGWTDPATGKEYVIASQGNNVSFVDISDPTLPVLVGNLPAPVPNILWRDVKVYNNHAYIVGDGNFLSSHGLQIFDLTQLRNVTVSPALLAQTARYTGFGRAHNIAINAETGYAYVVGSTKCAGGPLMLDLQDPANPVFAGCVDQDGYTHDAQCVVYNGPDADYQGREVCFNANEDTLTIVDVTDKANPVILARQPYEGSGYSHQGSLTEDQAYFILGDELDELNTLESGEELPRTRSYIWNVADLDAPVHFSTYLAQSTAIDHNLYVRDGFVFESNYTSGLRILDSGDIARGNLTEVAYFDTHPAGDTTTFAGTWSNYAYFESGVVAVNNIEDGLYLIRPNLPAPPLQAGTAAGGGWLRTSDDTKIEFEFSASKSTEGAAGSLSLTDAGQAAAIEIADVVFLDNVSGDCGDIAAGELSLELRGNGTFNGTPAEFRACFQDTHDPGKGLDRFYLECTAGCSYATSARAADSVIDAGNVQVERER